MRLPAQLVAKLRAFYEGRLVCVTGGAGFIGGHLCDALMSLGAVTTVLDDLSNSSLVHLSELIELDPARLRFVHGSVLDPSALREAIGAPANSGGGGGHGGVAARDGGAPSAGAPGVEPHGGAAAGQAASVIFHLAAVGSVQRSINDPARSFAVNAGGTVRVLEAARAAWGPTEPSSPGEGSHSSAARVRGLGRRIVLASSSSVYGGCERRDFGERRSEPEELQPRLESDPVNPLSPYAASKVAAEAALRGWGVSLGLSTVSLRFFNVFGPRQSADSVYSAVVAAFARRLLAGKAPMVFGDGSASRDFTYVGNVVAATLLAGASERPLAGEVFNVGVGERVTVAALARLMAERAGVPHLQPELFPERAGDVKHSLADIARARNVLGYSPVTALGDGLAETIDWYRRAYAGA